jgi:hypothetical protein
MTSLEWVSLASLIGTTKRMLMSITFTHSIFRDCRQIRGKYVKRQKGHESDFKIADKFFLKRMMPQKS